MERYLDRIDAGRRLGKLLAPRIDGPAVVLAVPRGGVQVGAQVAEALHAPMVPLLVRKVGLPEQPEVVVGAIDADGAMVTTGLAKDSGLLPAEMESMGEDVAMRLARWREVFGAPDPAEVVRSHVAVIVDDAVFTGLTTRAGIEFLRRRGAERILVAVPCGVSDSLDELGAMGVEIVAPIRVDRDEQIHSCYAHLPEVTAEEVSYLLARGGLSLPQGQGGTPSGDRSLRLVDGRAVAHKAVLRLPAGIGPWPGVVLAGRGTEPGTSAGDSLSARLAEAGIASVRLDLGGGAAEEAVLELALDVLSSRPELDPFRLGVVTGGVSSAPAAEVAAHDKRVVALAVYAPPSNLDVPDRSLIVEGGVLDVREIDRMARWLADRLRPG
ncbi:phosphoribosyltransferase family protein [Vulgatibacter incomptus]|uniref:Phosphoribosyl transferase domain protein n=1 Tax=Vulgatibacter incomptus TaxID=1391653 RepID=A0A0K1PEI7_9BACT|nr:phosphoribosyltransferase family protein [Vulgatibacter incomptus]AKU91948.1 Phosphoribosyl transferase domain protein [Vulgatibacter incomptus]